MLIKTLDRWKVKPKRWGSYSLVQQTIYKNCEKIYGIDPVHVALIFPMWECGGNKIYDYSKYRTDGTFVGTPSWYRNYINFSNNADTITSSFSNVSASAGTIILGFIPNWNDGDGKTHPLFDTYGGSNRRVAFYEAGSGSLLTLQTNSTSRGGFAYTWSANSIYNIAITWPTNICYINGVQQNDYTDGDLGNSSDTLYICNSYALNATGDGKFMYLYIFNNALTASQAKLFNDRPYGLFEKVNNPVYFY